MVERLGQRIAQLRTDRGLTQAELADRVGHLARRAVAHRELAQHPGRAHRRAARRHVPLRAPRARRRHRLPAEQGRTPPGGGGPLHGGRAPARRARRASSRSSRARRGSRRVPRGSSPRAGNRACAGSWPTPPTPKSAGCSATRSPVSPTTRRDRHHFTRARRHVAGWRSARRRSDRRVPRARGLLVDLAHLAHLAHLAAGLAGDHCPRSRRPRLRRRPPTSRSRVSIRSRRRPSTASAHPARGGRSISRHFPAARAARGRADAVLAEGIELSGYRYNIGGGGVGVRPPTARRSSTAADTAGPHVPARSRATRTFRC